MKNLFSTFLLLLTAFAGSAQEKNFIDQPYVEVAGSADTALMPDEIYLRIVVAEGEKEEAQMGAALKSLNINTDKDLSAGDAGSSWGFYALKDAPSAGRTVFTLKTTSPQAAAAATEKLRVAGISNVSIDRISHSALAQIQGTCVPKRLPMLKKTRPLW